MDTTVQFSLPTNREHFISWLDGQVGVVNRTPSKYKEGYLLLDVLIYPAAEEDKNDYSLVRIDGLYEYVADDGRRSMKRLESLLTFKVYEQQTKEDTRQVEVHGEYTAPPGRDYYHQILSRIGKRWPVSGLTKKGTKRKSPGRPREKAHDWAYNEVDVKKRSFEEVLPEWKAMRGSADQPKIDTLAYLKEVVEDRRKNPPRLLAK